jgi:hypothetical protein
MTHAQAQAISDLINAIEAIDGFATVAFALRSGWSVIYSDPTSDQATVLRSVHDFYGWLGRQGYAHAR